MGSKGSNPPPPKCWKNFFSLYKYANLLNASIIALAVCDIIFDSINLDLVLVYLGWHVNISGLSLFTFNVIVVFVVANLDNLTGKWCPRINIY